MILLIDNYDSFTYNLYQLIGTYQPQIKVVRNDELTVDQIRALNPSHIVISPGPGHPRAAGCCIEVIQTFYKQIPILGICLGHQAIYEAFGGTVSYAGALMHGKASTVSIDHKEPLFKGLGTTMEVARYHSLVGKPDTLPPDFKVVATSDDREIMAISHQDLPVYGVQFHPESIMTPQGDVIIRNFLGLISKSMI